MRRREFIALLGGAAAWPVAARAQPSERVRLIGVLMAFAENDPAAQSQVEAFRGALGKLGWAEGRNLRVELRCCAGDADMIKAFAKELIDMRPDAILGQTTAVIRALARETRTIPIVFAVVSDPIGSGFGASLAHPGGNITGFTTNEPAVGGKWIGLLKEIAPRTIRVALLFNPKAPQFFNFSIQAAASAPVHVKGDPARGYAQCRCHSARRCWLRPGQHIWWVRSRTPELSGKRAIRQNIEIIEY